MSCHAFSNEHAFGFICITPCFRLRLNDGRYIFMEWHNYVGPIFFRDRDMEREIVDWWEDPIICRAVDWFVARGKKA